MARLLIIFAEAVLTVVSVAVCLVLFGEFRPLCARAWRLRPVPFWGRWVTFWDARLAWYEDRHCERSADRWG